MAGSLGGADDLDDGRESLEAVCVDTEAEARFSVGSMAGKRATSYEIFRAETSLYHKMTRCLFELLNGTPRGNGRILDGLAMLLSLSFVAYTRASSERSEKRHIDQCGFVNGNLWWQ